MLVVDDSRLNLLKMKEKLLLISDNKSEKLLNDYKDLVISIDKDEYESLINKIKENNYRDLPLEEQVAFLNEIESDYNSLNELQCGYRNIYSKYSENELELSDISNILIDNIISRASMIQGYLMNSKNLANNKIELEKLNLDLIAALKKQDLINNKVLEVNKKIKDNVLNSEGRILNSHGEMIYTSIQEEFKSVDLDLKELLLDNDLLQKEYHKAEDEKKENDEMLEAALICYKRDNSNEEIYNKIKLGTKKSDYKLVLLEILNQICTDTYDYDLMINKLYRILNLIEERKLYLKSNFYIDPFERLKINDELEFLNAMGNNDSEINKIRKTITYFTSIIEDMENKNDEYLSNINNNIAILKEDEKIVNDSYLTKESNDNDYVIEFNYMNSDSKVIKIQNLFDGFMLDRVHEKTDGVINRVNELFNHNKNDHNDNNNDDNNNVNTAKNPELIIDDVSKRDEIVLKNDDDILEKKESSFNDLNKTETIINNENTDVIKEENSSNTLNDVSDNDKLFEEIVPFDDTPLFYDRIDSDVFGTENNVNNIKTDNVKINNNDDESMPDVFWTTTTMENNSGNEEMTEEVSFDDQINSLLNNDYNTKIKVR